MNKLFELENLNKITFTIFLFNISTRTKTSSLLEIQTPFLTHVGNIFIATSFRNNKRGV